MGGVAGWQQDPASCCGPEYVYCVPAGLVTSGLWPSQIIASCAAASGESIAKIPNWGDKVLGRCGNVLKPFIIECIGGMLGVVGAILDRPIEGCGLEVTNEEGVCGKGMVEATTWRFSRASRFG